MKYKNELEIKKIFVKNFKRICQKEKSQERTAEALGVSVDTIAKWRKENESTIPKINNMVAICNYFDCDPSYLFERDRDSFNLEYEKITEITGLSSKAIAVLNSIHNIGHTKDKNGITFDTPESLGRSQTAIKLINYVLEMCYDERPEYTIFDYIYQAIFLSDFISSKDDMTGFIHPETFEQITASKKDLFQTYNLNQVTKWIMDRYQEEEKRKKKDKQPVDNEEKH